MRSTTDRTARQLVVGIGAALFGIALLAAPALAQQGPVGASQRDCQTVRTCDFSRRGVVRGCLSSYSCRVCRTVRERCSVAGRPICERLVCTWGG